MGSFCHFWALCWFAFVLRRLTTHSRLLPLTPPHTYITQLQNGLRDSSHGDKAQLIARNKESETTATRAQRTLLLVITKSQVALTKPPKTTFTKIQVRLKFQANHDGLLQAIVRNLPSDARNSVHEQRPSHTGLFGIHRKPSA